MEIKITEGGRLYIKRGSIFRIQECPFREDVFCSDNCPLFDDSNLPDSLELCSAYWENLTVIDERK